MELQEKIIKAIEDNDTEGMDLDFVKYFSRTSLFPPKDYPAVIVDEEPFDFGQANGGVFGEVQECTIYLLTEVKNLNEMDESDYKGYKEESYAKMKILRDKIYDEVGNIEFGRGDNYMTTIESVPVMCVVVPVKKTILN